MTDEPIQQLLRRLSVYAHIDDEININKIKEAGQKFATEVSGKEVGVILDPTSRTEARMSIRNIISYEYTTAPKMIGRICQYTGESNTNTLSTARRYRFLKSVCRKCITCSCHNHIFCHFIINIKRLIIRHNFAICVRRPMILPGFNNHESPLKSFWHMRDKHLT